MPENPITIFSKNGWEIRSLEKDGEPWFVAKDICVALGFKNHNTAISNHLEDDEKGILSADTLGGKQDLSVINESGMYALVFKSTKPESRKFRKWVTSEVLPEIRKSGSYFVDVPKTLSEALQLAADQARLIETQTEELEHAKPKVEFVEKYVESSGLFNLTQASKNLNFKRKDLISCLLRDGRIFRRGKKGSWNRM